MMLKSYLTLKYNCLQKKNCLSTRRLTSKNFFIRLVTENKLLFEADLSKNF